MYSLLYKYLILHRQVGIPGIGAFVLEKEPARLDMVNKMIHAPSYVIRFKPNTTAGDKGFYEYLSDELKCDVFQAIKKFQDFSFDLKEEVQRKKWVELPGMGILTQGVRDEIKFKSSAVLKEYFPATVSDKVVAVHEAAEETESHPHLVATTAEGETEATQKDYWWIYALILTVVGAAAIFYYYYFYLKRS